MKEFTFGQFYPSDSVIHRMDARFKFIITTIYLVAVFMAKAYFSFLYLGLFLILAITISKVPVRVIIKTLKPIMILVLITMILNLLFYSEGTTLWKWWIFDIKEEAISFCIFMALRLILLVAGSSLLTLTTQPVELTDGLESLLTPLKWIHFPVHELALIMSIALRFIPILMDEADRIVRAQKARGADFESGNIMSRAKSLIPIMVPLLVSSFRRADELADAMDARCYAGGDNRTKYKQFSIDITDFTGLIFIVSILLLIITTNQCLG